MKLSGPFQKAILPPREHEPEAFRPLKKILAPRTNSNSHAK